MVSNARFKFTDFVAASPERIRVERVRGSTPRPYILAVGVVDVLPSCLSSKYFFWEPSLKALALGKLSSLREIDWVREASSHCPTLRYYYMGKEGPRPLTHSPPVWSVWSIHRDQFFGPSVHSFVHLAPTGQ